MVRDTEIWASSAGGDGGIRTLDRPLQAYNGLANRRLQPLGHVSNMRGMPDPAACRKRQNHVRAIFHLKAIVERLRKPCERIRGAKGARFGSPLIYVCPYLVAGPPDPPMRRRNQHWLAGPDVEPDAGPAPAGKIPGQDARLVWPSEFQVAIIGCDLNRQPLTRYRAILVGVAHAARI